MEDPAPGRSALLLIPAANYEQRETLEVRKNANACEL